MPFIKEFITKHPIISLCLAKAAIDGTAKIIKTVAYAITGREGLNPCAVQITYTPDKEEETNESAVTVE